MRGRSLSSIAWTAGSARELAFLVLGALLVRGAMFALRGDYLDWDETLYLLMARNVLDGSGIALNGAPHIALGPFVPVATAALSVISGLELLTAQRSLMTLGGALLLIPLWYLLRLHAGERIARIGTILAVGWPAFIDVAPKLGPMWRHLYAGTEPVFLAFVFGSFALGEAALRRQGVPRYGLCALAGISLACGYLARPEAVVIAAAYVVFRSLPWFRHEKRKVLATAYGVTAAAFLLVAGPYLLHMRQLTNSWTLSGKLQPARLTSSLYQDLVRDDRYMGSFVKTWWALDPSHSYLLNPYWGVGSVPVERRLAEFERAVEAEWNPASGASGQEFKRARSYVAALWILGGPLFLSFAVLGLAWSEGGLRSRFPPFVLAGFAASWLTTSQLFAMPRFFLYLIPALALWAARGIVLTASYVAARGVKVPDRAIALAFLMAAFAVAAGRTLSAEATRLRQVGTENRLTAERLASGLRPNERVFTWHPRLAFWAHLDWRALPVAPLDAITHYAANNEVGFLFLASAGYSPLPLEAPYVLLVIDPALAEALRRIPTSGDEHAHPLIRLVPVEPIAGFPTGRVALAPAKGMEPTDGP